MNDTANMICKRQTVKLLIWLILILGCLNILRYSTWKGKFAVHHAVQEDAKRSSLVIKPGITSSSQGDADQNKVSLNQESLRNQEEVTNPTTNGTQHDIKVDEEDGDETILEQVDDNSVLSLDKLSPLGNVTLTCGPETYVVAFIISLPSHIGLRQAIRKTWARAVGEDARKIQFVFVTGSTKDNLIQNMLLQDFKQHGDILIGDFIFDINIKISLPLFLGLSWALKSCDSFQYMYVGNDYTLLNYEKLLQRLDYNKREGISDTRSWIGTVITGSKVQRDPKSVYYVSNGQYDMEFFPPFCTEEHGFVLTRSIAEEMFKSAMNRKFIQIADVFIGTLARDGNWTLVNDKLFTNAIYNLELCSTRVFVTMRLVGRPDELISYWRKSVNCSELLNEVNPDLDVVLPSNVKNTEFLENVLAYRLNNRKSCYDNTGEPLNLFMLVLISSPPDHAGAREGIRKTWCKDKVVLRENIKCLFVMGVLPAETEDVTRQVQLENDTSGDIIQASFEESFRNLTLKVILGLKWITENCQHAKYFYKGDDDMFVNFVNIISHIKSLRSKGEAMEKFFIGSHMGGSVRFSPSIREHRGYKRYQVPDNMYYGSYYPPYCSGGGYIMSTDTVPDMYRESMRISLINVDDAFQGILTKRLGFGPVGHPGFKSWGGNTDTCYLRDKNTMTIHGIGRTVEEHLTIWNAYMNVTANCTAVSMK